MKIYAPIYKKGRQGFTLIEVLVSVAIFSVVMVMAVGALLSLSTAARKAQALKSAVDNLNFAIESMSRSIRTGYGYNCGSVTGGNCPGGNNTFVFTTNNGVVTYYRLESLNNDSNAAAVCGQTAPNVGCVARSTDGINWAPITSPDVIIDDLSSGSPASYLFHLFGAAAGSTDNRQPLVVLTLSGYAQVTASQQSAFHLQSTITQRLYDQ